MDGFTAFRRMTRISGLSELTVLICSFMLHPLVDFFPMQFFVWSSRSGFLPSLDDGESGARARLASRTSSVATSCRTRCYSDCANFSC